MAQFGAPLPHADASLAPLIACNRRLSKIPPSRIQQILDPGDISVEDLSVRHFAACLRGEWGDNHRESIADSLQNPNAVVGDFKDWGRGLVDHLQPSPGPWLSKT
jgi:hypothetical protein